MGESMELPYAAEAELDISVPELEYLEAKYNAERSQNSLTADTQFVYSWGLIRSRYSDDIKLGIEILRDLQDKYPDRARECLYYQALGYYRQADYDRSRKLTEKLLSLEPENLQAASLLEKINSKVAKEGVIGLALVGGAVAALAGMAIAILRNRRGPE